MIRLLYVLQCAIAGAARGALYGLGARVEVQEPDEEENAPEGESEPPTAELTEGPVHIVWDWEGDVTHAEPATDDPAERFAAMSLLGTLRRQARGIDKIGHG